MAQSRLRKNGRARTVASPPASGSSSDTIHAAVNVGPSTKAFLSSSTSPVRVAPIPSRDGALPTGPEILAELQVFLRVEGDWSSVVEQLLGDLEHSSSNVQRALILQRIAGILFHELDDPDQAIDALLEAYANDPEGMPLAALEHLVSQQNRWTDLLEMAKKVAAASGLPDQRREIKRHIAEWSKRIAFAERAIPSSSNANREDYLMSERPVSEALSRERLSGSASEKDWRARAAFLKRQAEFLREPVRQADALLRLAGLLSIHETETDNARKYFEQAARLIPEDGRAWRGLYQLAVWSGQQNRAEFYLEQWALHSQSPTEKGEALVELAHYRHLVLGKPVEARNAYKHALQVDPNNVRAAEAMVPHYLENKRWEVAAVLAEILLRDARAREDSAKLLASLELSERIATERNNSYQRVQFAVEAFEHAPESPILQRRLLEACVSAKKDPPSLKPARSALESLAHASWEAEPDALATIGEVLLCMGESASGYEALTQALVLAPYHAGAMLVLGNDALTRRDWESAARWKEQVAYTLEGGDDERFRLLTEAGDLWLRQVGARDDALRVYEDALTLRPHDRTLLHTMLGVYSECDRWEEVVATLHAIAAIEPDPVYKAKSLYAMAQAADEKLNDPARAAQLYEEVLKLDPSRLDAFERIGRIYTRRKDWPFLAKAYRAMIGRVDPASDPRLAYTLCHQLGLIYRDRIGDIPRALDVFTAAADLQPDNADAQRIVAELLVSTERVDAAVEIIRATLLKQPFSPEPYRDLYTLHMREHAYDKAWCTAEVLSLWGPLRDDERAFLQAHSPLDASKIPSALTEEAWKAHLPHPAIDDFLTQILGAITPAFLRVRLTSSSSGVASNAPLATMDSPAAKRVKAAFRNAGDVLALPIPELYANANRWPPLLLPVVSTTPALIVALDLVEGMTDAVLSFLAAKHITEQRPEYRARAIKTSPAELRRLLVAAAQISTGAQLEAGAFETVLSSRMTSKERVALEHAVQRTTDSGALLDAKKWLQSVDLTGMRAGLLVCGSIVTAKRAMSFEDRHSDDLPTRAWLQELACFAVDDFYAELRQAIGVAVANE